ncbi:hypothetical protein FNB79_17060 [Formosa sediminum]|uniref:Lysoplasmalogenase n=1 Tax=Formosa sediminum TaxID=2594004 RepID=A0A516GVQ3_9FLAO|nr:hypothetical protein [Formosa sediminum]QDO95607.1 hypothetical protein FNB79_17060 [Formosa sediminum]
MKKTYYLIIIIFLYSVFFFVLEMHNFPKIAAKVKAVVVPSICVFYIIDLNNKLLFFKIFLILFSITDLLIFTDAFIPINFKYYIGNTLYIVAYIILIYSVVRRVDLSKILTEFKLTVGVLFLMNIYVLYALLNVDLVLESSPLISSMSSVILELIYNAVTFILFTVSFLNYLYKNNKESLYLFIGTLCVVFSEVIQFVTTYPSNQKLLNTACYVLLVLGFSFFYLFASLKAVGEQEIASL